MIDNWNTLAYFQEHQWWLLKSFKTLKWACSSFDLIKSFDFGKDDQIQGLEICDQIQGLEICSQLQTLLQVGFASGIFFDLDVGDTDPAVQVALQR